jgi:hypothetical protein
MIGIVAFAEQRHKAKCRLDACYPAQTAADKNTGRWAADCPQSKARPDGLKEIDDGI